MTRERLPNRRTCRIFDVCYGNMAYSVSIGRYPDGRPAEVFISSDKHSSEAALVARDAAVLLSIALQYHIPVETMRGAITRLEDGGPASIMGCVLDLLSEPPCDVAPADVVEAAP